MVVAWSGVQECEFKDRAVVGLMFGRWRGGGGGEGRAALQARITV